MKSFFNPDNFIFRWAVTIFDVLALSILWLLCCLPVVTIGPATTALYYAATKCVRKKQPDTFKNFFSSFRENLKVGVGYTLTYLVIALVLFGIYGFLLSMITVDPNMGSPMIWGFLLFVLFLFGAYQCGIVLLSRFSYTLPALLRDSLRITFGHLPRVLLSAVIALVMLALSLQYYYAQIWFITPCLTQIMVSEMMEPVLKKYIPNIEELMQLPYGERPWYLQ